jgi:hypothetical protein
VNFLDKLKDIRGIVKVDDYSLYLLVFIVVVLSLMVAFLLYKYFTKIRKTKKQTKKQIAKLRLKNLDFSNSKDVAYSFSIDGYLFVDEKNKQEFNLIEKELENFKYKKDVEVIPDNLKLKIQKFIKGLR